jgi:hypothetical protein
MNRHTCTAYRSSQPVFEALEDRTLQAAHPTFDLGRLTGYGLR